MIKRKIIKIDESLCDGCALCIPSCPEGALKIIDGKAKLVKESYCDGLGACIGNCPQKALSVVEALTEEYDELGVIEHIKLNDPKKLQIHINQLSQHKNGLIGVGCPSSKTICWEQSVKQDRQGTIESQLRQWPIQLHLVSPTAPYFKNADLVIVADCVPFAYASFHTEFLSGNAIVIACPKLDDTTSYIQKLTKIFDIATPKSIKVIIMEVPCCAGLVKLTQDALKNSNSNLNIEVVIIGIKGFVSRTQKLYY